MYTNVQNAAYSTSLKFRRASVIIVIIYSHHSAVVCSDIIYNKTVDNMRWHNKWVSNIEDIKHFNNNIGLVN